MIGWFTGSPDEYNPTNAKIVEGERKAKEREEEFLRKEKEVRKREVDILKLEEEVKLHLEQARLQDEILEKREKKVKEKEEEAKQLADVSKKAVLDAQRRKEQVQKELQQAKFYLEKGIQPEVWPTEEEFQLAKNRVQYDPEKLHFAICGSSGSGKSSLVNAFRGLKNGSPQAAPTGVVETTMNITRYPEPRQELPYNRLVWFDCPGAGTLEIPGWQYFNQQGLFIFDVIVLVYDSVIISI